MFDKETGFEVDYYHSNYFEDEIERLKEHFFVKGTKVKFSNKNGLPYERALANTLLGNKELTVRKCDIGGFSSYYEFEECPGKRFNTVMFEELNIDTTKWCTILVGLPASGKSTWINSRKSKIKYPRLGRIISSDNIIQDNADHYGFTYDETWHMLKEFAEKVFWFELKAAGKNEIDDIFVDRTNLSIKSRKKIIDTLKPFGYKFKCVVFKTPEYDEWHKRLNSRPGKTIPVNVLENMSRSYMEPTKEEGFEEIIYVG